MTWINYIFITGFSSYCRYLKVADHFLPKEVKQQNEDLTKSFGEWLQYLTVGFNLLVTENLLFFTMLHFEGPTVLNALFSHFII